MKHYWVSVSSCILLGYGGRMEGTFLFCVLTSIVIKEQARRNGFLYFLFLYFLRTSNLVFATGYFN